MISSMTGRVANKDTSDGARSKLVNGVGRSVRIAQATEEMEMGISRCCTIEMEVRGRHGDSTRGVDVNEMDGSGKSFGPKARTHVSLEQ